VRTIGAAVLVGAVVALGAMLFALGIRVDLDQVGALIFLLLKLAFTIGNRCRRLDLSDHARPATAGKERRRSSWRHCRSCAIMLLAAINLTFASSSHWNKMIVGDQLARRSAVYSYYCYRTIAPRSSGRCGRWRQTDLVRTGALAGLVAGGISATAYALHCTDDSVPFVRSLVWRDDCLVHFAGATLGPRLLRW